MELTLGIFDEHNDISQVINPSVAFESVEQKGFLFVLVHLLLGFLLDSLNLFLNRLPTGHLSLTFHLPVLVFHD